VKIRSYKLQANKPKVLLVEPNLLTQKSYVHVYPSLPIFCELNGEKPKSTFITTSNFDLLELITLKYLYQIFL